MVANSTETDEQRHLRELTERRVKAAAKVTPEDVAAVREHNDLKLETQAELASNVQELSQGLSAFQHAINRWMKHQGFWDSGATSEKLMLIVTEVAEACEADRKKDAANFAEELADTVIRILDLAEHHQIDLARAILVKMHANLQRPHRHGKEY